MILSIKDKECIINKIGNIIRSVSSIIIVEYSKIKSNQINELRKICHHENIFTYITRNTLFIRAIQNTPFVCLTKKLIGKNLILFYEKSPGIVINILNNFKKNDIKFEIKTVLFNGKILSELQINRLAIFISEKEALNCLILTIKDIFLGRLLRILIALNHYKTNII